mmetsp:Transcript_21713/g.42660  ORF Transcript_21713/g.42660 Transcript_21713/m.42660 type:complete len:281 (-) Transcript_21713:364-1206(-)
MRDHCCLRATCSTARVHQRSAHTRDNLANTFFKCAHLYRVTKLEKLGKGEHTNLGPVCTYEIISFVCPANNGFKVRELVNDFGKFLKVGLVFNNGDRCVAVESLVLHLGSCVRRVNTCKLSTTVSCAHCRQEPLWGVETKNGNSVEHFHTEVHKCASNPASISLIFLPCPALPILEWERLRRVLTTKKWRHVFCTESYLVSGTLDGKGQHLRKCHGRHDASRGQTSLCEGNIRDRIFLTDPERTIFFVKFAVVAGLVDRCNLCRLGHCRIEKMSTNLITF